MNTLKSKQIREPWEATLDFHVSTKASRSPTPVRKREVQPNLIESDEYEWTTPLSLPGLLVSPSMMERPLHMEKTATRHPTDEYLETEEGDAVIACQLPGGLAAVSASVSFVPSKVDTQNELEACDEYTEVAALQLPGRLLAQRPSSQPSIEHHPVRGLCATCVHHLVCDFPRPAGGVWRCEEYA